MYIPHKNKESRKGSQSYSVEKDPELKQKTQAKRKPNFLSKEEWLQKYGDDLKTKET
jgi:hypothetical protein